MYKNGHRDAFLYMTLQTGTTAARQRGAAATSEPGPGGSGPAALLPGTLVASSEGLEVNPPEVSGVTGVEEGSEGKVAGPTEPEAVFACSITNYISKIWLFQGWKMKTLKQPIF